MIRRASALLLVVTSGLLLTSACKKEEEPQAIPVPSAASAAPMAADTTAPTAAAPTTTAAATPPPNQGANAQPGTPTKQSTAAGESIEGCCAALSAMSLLSGKSAESKAKAATSSKICYGIAKHVKDGKTSKAAAMAQIKSSLGGVVPPSECN